MEKVQHNQEHNTKEVFRGRIRNTFLLTLLPISIFFILLISGLTYLRARRTIQDQIYIQLKSNLASAANEIDTWLTTKRIRLDLAIHKPVIARAIESVLTDHMNETQKRSSKQDLLGVLDVINRQGEGLLFNHILLVSPQGEIILATQPNWEGQNIDELTYYQTLLESSGSLIIHSPEPLFPNDVVVLTAVPYFDAQNDLQATLVAISGSGPIVGYLESAIQFNTSAESYLITPEENFIKLDQYQQIVRLETPSEQQLEMLIPLQESHIYGSTDDPFRILPVVSFDGRAMISSYTWLPALSAGLVVEIPQEVAFGGLNELGPYTFVFSLLSLIILMGMIIIATNRLVKPLQSLTNTALSFSQGNWDQRAPSGRNDEIGQLSYTFNQMADDLSEIYQSLERQVVERTQTLEKRSQQFEATALVAREASAIRDLDELLDYASRLISDHFGFYHVGIFLLDRANQFAILQASNSNGGKRMLARSHRLEVGQKGVVGHVAASGTPRIALDVGEDAYFFNNPDLPETRSEMALPLKIREQIIGILDVQSTRESAFSESDVEALQILADQIALAIENARLLEQTQSAMENLEKAYGTQTKVGWEGWLKEASKAYHFDRARIHPATLQQVKQLRQFEDHQTQIKETPAGFELYAPIRLRGQKLGVVSLTRPKDIGNWTPREIKMVEDSLSQIAVALDSTRLLHETRRYAQHEQTLSEFSTQLSQSIDIENILKTAVKQLGRLPNVEGASIHIKPPPNEHPTTEENA